MQGWTSAESLVPATSCRLAQYRHETPICSCLISGWVGTAVGLDPGAPPPPPPRFATAPDPRWVASAQNLQGERRGELLAEGVSFSL